MEHSFNKRTLHDNNKFLVYNEVQPPAPPLKQYWFEGINLNTNQHWFEGERDILQIVSKELQVFTFDCEVPIDAVAVAKMIAYGWDGYYYCRMDGRGIQS